MSLLAADARTRTAKAHSASASAGLMTPDATNCATDRRCVRRRLTNTHTKEQHAVYLLTRDTTHTSRRGEGSYMHERCERCSRCALRHWCGTQQRGNTYTFFRSTYTRCRRLLRALVYQQEHTPCLLWYTTGHYGLDGDARHGVVDWVPRSGWRRRCGYLPLADNAPRRHAALGCDWRQI